MIKISTISTRKRQNSGICKIIYIFINFGNLLCQQPYNIRKQVRNIETNKKKLIQAKMAVVLNNTCINEKLLPTFTNIYARLNPIEYNLVISTVSVVNSLHA